MKLCIGLRSPTKMCPSQGASVEVVYMVLCIDGGFSHAASGLTLRLDTKVPPSSSSPALGIKHGEGQYGCDLGYWFPPEQVSES